MFKKLCRAAFGVVLALAFFSAPALAVPAGTMVYEYNSSNNITTATTTNVKNAPGLVALFCVNTVGTTSTLVLWDSLSASGTKIGTWTTTAVGCYPINAVMRTGITVVTTGSPAADITIFFR